MPGPLSIPTIRRVPPDQTHALRHRVLRPHQTLAEMVYDGDDRASTIHLAAFIDAAGPDPIGIVTLSADPLIIQPRPGDYRLRGMAVHEQWQGLQIGRKLVTHATEAAAQAGCPRLWCNARLSAEQFYAKLGFQRIGEEFEIEHIGRHVRMFLPIE